MSLDRENIILLLIMYHMLIKERDINCPNGRKKVFLTDQEKQQ
jgi:hypothetical protein